MYVSVLQTDCMISRDSTRIITVLVVLSDSVLEMLDSSGISKSSSSSESSREPVASELISVKNWSEASESKSSKS